MSISLSLSEVELQLERAGAAPMPEGLRWRFTTTPDHLQTMQQGMAAAVAAYQDRYGQLHGLRPDRSAVRFREDDERESGVQHG